MTEEPLDPGMHAFNLELAKHTPPEAVTWPLARQRQAWNEVCARFRAARPAGLEVRDINAAGVPVRLYRLPGPQPKPGVLYGHGGGWVLGSLETHDDMCAELAMLADVAVAAVDYRLAPEHPHPAQLQDMLAVLGFLRGHGGGFGIDPARIMGAGDSAGGQLTAGLCLYLRDHSLPQLAGQVLIYPALGAGMDTASYRRNADAPSLSRADMVYYLESVLGPRGGAAWQDPYALPLLASDLRSLPPAFITAAAHDPLYDDGVEYHARLLSAGIESELRREPALAHSYMRARHSSIPAMAGFRAIAAAVRRFGHAERDKGAG